MLTRIKTAGIMILAIIVLVYFDIWILNFLVFMAILALSFLESLVLFKIDKWQLVFITAFSFVAFSFYSSNFESAYKFIFVMLIAIASYLSYKNRKNWNSILPFFYPVVPIFIMFSVYDTLGINYLIFVLVIVIATDSGAYFIGRAIGKHKFSPTSPNKTLEGVIGGVICGVLVGILCNKLFLHNDDFGIFKIVLISICCVFGDLFESYLKRKADVKDSGNLFPGHGGMLDRIDGLLFSSMALSLVVSW